MMMHALMASSRVTVTALKPQQAPQAHVFPCITCRLLAQKQSLQQQVAQLRAAADNERRVQQQYEATVASYMQDRGLRTQELKDRAEEVSEHQNTSGQISHCNSTVLGTARATVGCSPWPIYGIHRFQHSPVKVALSVATGLQQSLQDQLSVQPSCTSHW